MRYEENDISRDNIISIGASFVSPDIYVGIQILKIFIPFNISSIHFLHSNFKFTNVMY